MSRTILPAQGSFSNGGRHVLALLLCACASTAPHTLPSESARSPWGAPRTDPRTESIIRSTLDATVKGELGASTGYGAAVFVGQQVWSQLRHDDPALAARGKPTMGLPLGRGEVRLEMRTFVNDQVADLVDSKGWQSLAAYFMGGVLRAATERERYTWCAVTPFEIKNRSVVGYERDGRILIVYLDGERIQYLELLRARD